MLESRVRSLRSSTWTRWPLCAICCAYFGVQLAPLERVAHVLRFPRAFESRARSFGDPGTSPGTIYEVTSTPLYEALKRAEAGKTGGDGSTAANPEQVRTVAAHMAKRFFRDAFDVHPPEGVKGTYDRYYEEQLLAFTLQIEARITTTLLSLSPPSSPSHHPPLTLSHPPTLSSQAILRSSNFYGVRLKDTNEVNQLVSRAYFGFQPAPLDVGSCA